MESALSHTPPLRQLHNGYNSQTPLLNLSSMCVEGRGFASPAGVEAVGLVFLLLLFQID
jgi:hypothetical protein